MKRYSVISGKEHGHGDPVWYVYDNKARQYKGDYTGWLATCKRYRAARRIAKLLNESEGE